MSRVIVYLLFMVQTQIRQGEAEGSQKTPSVGASVDYSKIKMTPGDTDRSSNN